MKESPKHPVWPSPKWSWGGPFRGSKRIVWNNLYYNVGFITLAALLALILMFHTEDAMDLTSVRVMLHHMISAPTELEMQQQWNPSTWSFEPKVSDWDKHRGRWRKEGLWREEAARPRVLMVTGSSPHPCDPPILSHLLLRSGKNKLDYCRQHGMELFYNMGEPDPDFTDWWVKLPLIRMLMLENPEFEWIWWLDADAIITDMSFEPPFAELKSHNLVLHGDDTLVYQLRDWESVSTASFMIRNCQWSLDLLDAWGSLRQESGNLQSEELANSPPDFPGYNQSGLVALLAQDQRRALAHQKWVPSVKLVKETEYIMDGNWTVVGPALDLDPPLQQVPFVTHFRGCLPACTGEADQLPSERLDVCAQQLERAFDYADNQVYRQYGFQPRTLGQSLEPLVKTESASEENADDGRVYSIPPRVTDWDEKRRVWMDEHPSEEREEVLLVSGSPPKPCVAKAGAHFLLWGLKNRIDYARVNGVSKFFYNMAVIDKDLIGWWSKLPLVKMLMLSNPNVEWIWWMDSDAPFTDMDFQLPFSRYNTSGYNLVMYGSEHEVFDKRSYVGINTGNVLLRNCQWTLDLLDRWASFGATEELRQTNEDLLNNYLSDRPSGWGADDQCVLAYVLISEQEKWRSQACLETSFTMSGDWQQCVTQYVDGVELEIKPFVTHFAGCHPCRLDVGEKCLKGMERAYNFADNQVLERYELRHDQLDSSALRKTSQLSVRDGIEDLEGKEEKDDALQEQLEESSTASNADSKEDGHTGSIKEMEKGSTSEFHGHSKDKQLDPASGEEKSDKATEEEKESEVISHESPEATSKQENVEQSS